MRWIRDPLRGVCTIGGIALGAFVLVRSGASWVWIPLLIFREWIILGALLAVGVPLYWLFRPLDKWLNPPLPEETLAHVDRIFAEQEKSLEVWRKRHVRKRAERG